MSKKFLSNVRVTQADNRRFTNIASSWVQLHNTLSTLSEEELLKLLLWERTNKKRMHMLLRIKGRYNTVRENRERQELLSDV
jgi:hypothetical protein